MLLNPIEIILYVGRKQNIASWKKGREKPECSAAAKIKYEKNKI